MRNLDSPSNFINQFHTFSQLERKKEIVETSNSINQIDIIL